MPIIPAHNDGASTAAAAAATAFRTATAAHGAATATALRTAAAAATAALCTVRVLTHLHIIEGHSYRLPIPAACTQQQSKSSSDRRHSVTLGWAGAKQGTTSTTGSLFLTIHPKLCIASAADRLPNC